MCSLRKGIVILFMSLGILFADAKPGPPVLPEIKAVSNNEQISLIWDAAAEYSIDPLTGYADFEGYRIYRSDDGGKTWGTSFDKIYDYYTQDHVAWKPYAQFSLLAESDSLHCTYSNAYYSFPSEQCSNIRGQDISGYDPMARWNNLGDDENLKRVFVDTDVLDGVEYTYAITAYDMGMLSFNVDWNILYNNINTAFNNPVASDDCDRTYSAGGLIFPFYNEDQCNAMPHCYWDFSSCKYSEENYCSNHDSYCDGMECCLDENCCQGALFDAYAPNQEQCVALGGVWLPEAYANEGSCEDAGYEWQFANHEHVDYSEKSECEAAGHNWKIVKYLEEETCEAVHGFSIGDSTIAGCGTLINLEFEGEATGLSDIIISNTDGEGIPFTYFDCGNGVCNDNETVEICPEDCCVEVNEECVTLISSIGCDEEQEDGTLVSEYCPVSCDICIEEDVWDGDACSMPNYSIHITQDGSVLYNSPSYCSWQEDTTLFSGYDIDLSECTDDGIGEDSTWVDLDIAGFEFQVDGVDVESILSASGGEVDAPGFVSSWGHEWENIYFSADTVWSSYNPEHFIGLDYSSDYEKLWGYPSFESSRFYESFADYNTNGRCDYDEHSGEYEPFIDLDSSDSGQMGICDETGDWTSRCEDDKNDCINVAVVQSGYKASNVIFPEDIIDEEYEFIVSDSTNVGNGDRFYNIVNEYELETEVLRFEINADLDPESFGDLGGSYSTLNPKLYVYEILSVDNLDAKNTNNIPIDQFDADSLEIILELPGVKSNDNFIIMPEYKIENFGLLGVDNPQYGSNFTDWFDGIQFRFDNGPNFFTSRLQLVELKSVDYFDSNHNAHTVLDNLMSTKMRYKDLAHLTKRLMYRYRVEFKSTNVDNAIISQGDCPPEFYTPLPFKVTNISTGQQVELEHNDGGMQIGEIEFGELNVCSESCGVGARCYDSECRKLIGYKNCQWEFNELIVIVDSVYTTNPPVNTSECIIINSGDSEIYKCKEKIFDVKFNFSSIDYFLKYIPNLFQLDQEPQWCFWDDQGFECVPVDKFYVEGDFVIYNNMIYVATENISETIKPDLWIDDGEGENDNPWQIKYLWNDGDYVDIEPYGWYKDGDAWTADISEVGRLDENSTDDLQNISVVPNPYIVSSNYFNESSEYHVMRFTRLPNECNITIYSITGELVKSISHNDRFNGNEWWDLRNFNNQEVAPGLYIYVVETPSGNKKIDKFAVVR